jgi:spermidine/putrescine transport system permease protein
MTSLRNVFLAPAAALLVLLFGAPLLIIVLYSLHDRGVYGGIAPVWTAANYLRLFDPLYALIFLRTFVMAAVSTAGCLLLGFPLALFISRAGKQRHLYLQLVILPFWTSFLVRTYAWMFLLRDTGLINTILIGLGVISEPLPLLYNDGAVFLGLIYGHLPFVVLPIYASLERMDKALAEASADLGATPWQTLTRVILPLSTPGLRAAGLLVFIPCLGAYLTPDLLGGGKTVMAGNLIQNQFTTARDWPFGSAVSLVLMAVVMAMLIVWLRRYRDEEML